jgi:hypothetical protein
MKALLLSLFLALGLSAAGHTFAQSGVSASRQDTALQRKLLRMDEEDQRYRDELAELIKKLAGPDRERITERLMKLSAKQERIDRRNREELSKIIQKYGWPGISLVGPEANRAAFLVVQHADLTYQKRYFDLIKEAVNRNEARPSDFAMLQDSVLTKEGKKQIYGTALHTNEKTGALELFPIEDEANVDARRASVGLPPMTEYLKVMGLVYKPPAKQ